MADRIQLAPDVARAVAKYGSRPRFDRWARRTYGIAGTQLLARLTAGENAGRMGGDPSSAGARSAFQFIPSTRADFQRRFGIDPWRTADESAEAATIHLMGKGGAYGGGLGGYNPGGGRSYIGYILGQRTSGVRAASSGLPAAAGARQGGPASVTRGQVEAGGTGLSDLVRALSEQRQQTFAPPSVGVTPPSFAAGPTLPEGYRAPTPGGQAPGQLEPVSSLLDAVKQLRAQGLPETKVTGGGTRARSPARAAPGTAGAVNVASGAERPGVRTQPIVKRLLGLAAGVAGTPITITTGTNHNQFVLGTNRESEHWTGHAADIAFGGDAREDAATRRQGDHVAASVLIAAGVPRRQAISMARHGGVYNVDWNGRRVQVLWKTDTGGNHYNHVHVGVS